MDYIVTRGFAFDGEYRYSGDILTDIAPETGKKLESLDVAKVYVLESIDPEKTATVSGETDKTAEGENAMKIASHDQPEHPVPSKTPPIPNGRNVRGKKATQDTEPGSKT